MIRMNHTQWMLVGWLAGWQSVRSEKDRDSNVSMYTL